MSLEIASLNSGSNGNCYYIGNTTEAVLIDAGISCRETEKRMLRAGLSMQKVKAIFISHEHTDHIRGLEVLSRKFKLPVYITPRTLNSGGLQVEETLLQDFQSNGNFSIGSLNITAFAKKHDAADPCSFVIESGGTSVGVFTDIGACCEKVITHFQKCHAVFLESNYDTEMLMNGHYPYYLKKRISGGEGHLSNAEALELFMNYKSDFLSHILLSHLSKENNSPQLVQKLFSEQAGDTYVEVASRYYESKVHTITAGSFANTAVESPSQEKVQLSLF
ncbi:MAG: MBL fold metallo-hydrolase [Bacteroidetes bacterium]|nr:MBL fold metallo-hydrolase [Bacteroidota bacterium]